MKRIVPVLSLIALLTAGSIAVAQHAFSKSNADITQREREAEPLYLAAVKASANAGDLRDRAAQARVLDALEAALKTGASAARALCDKAFADLHTIVRFRELIGEHTVASEVTLTVPGEPGQPLRVSGVVRDASGKPVAGALVGAYHTDARGIYSELGNEHPRIFGYMRTDAQGRYAYNSIRPAQYPNDSGAAQHVHYVVEARGYQSLTTELQFADDPLWKKMTMPTDAAKVSKDERGVDCCTFDMMLESAR